MCVKLRKVASNFWNEQSSSKLTMRVGEAHFFSRNSPGKRKVPKNKVPTTQLPSSVLALEKMKV